MADFSSSGILGLPPLTLDTIQTGDPQRDAKRMGDARIVNWIRDAVVEGDRINREDPSYDMAAVGMRYVVGDQRRDVTAEPPPRYLPRMTVNESRKVTQAHASVLTDLKPVWAYKSLNEHFKQHGQLITNLVIAWYVNTMADFELANAVKYSLAGGTADLACDYDPQMRFGGDSRLRAKDFRDTLPWRPSPGSRSEQDWQGVIFREEHTVNVLRGMYPTKAHLVIPGTDSLLATLMGRFRSAVNRLVSPQTDTLSGLTGISHDTKPRSGNAILYKAYLADQSLNLTTSPIPMGPPGAVWAYVVPPGGKLYPYKRLIVATPEAILWDGPSPYWHGLFPFSRLKLWEVPWQFLGVPLLNDLSQIQDGINDLTNEVWLGIKKWLNPTVVHDRQAVGETFMRTFDPRRPGGKIKTNPTYGDGFKMLDGPPGPVLQLALQFVQHLTNKHGDLSGVANLQGLLELRQMPGADTIRTYYEAMTPELRAEGRAMEGFLRPIAEMLKSNIFQYQTKAKRITLLGDAGLTLSDFDFDPQRLIPALSPEDKGYTPELDEKLPIHERAQFFQSMFAFTVAPNSLLAMNAQEQKMLRLQLARMGYYDFWSLMESLEIPNVGTPPQIPLPPVEQPDPLEVLNSLAQGDGRFLLDPASGQILQVRTPQTITERLMAQQQLGIGMTENPAGRKASGQEMPENETKTDDTGAPRQTVTESSK